MIYLKTYESYTEEDIDKVLDKINKSGRESLTKEEEYILKSGENNISYKDKIIEEIRDVVLNKDGYIIIEENPLVYDELDDDIQYVEGLLVDVVEVSTYNYRDKDRDLELETEYIPYSEIETEILEKILDVIK